jgi:hypothetical protein
MMFEILSQFLEKECSPGIVEWYVEYGHKITVDGEEKYVRDEMQELYDWWHKKYNKEYPAREEALYDLKPKSIRDFRPCDDEEGEDGKYGEYYVFDPEYETEEDERLADACRKALNDQEREVEEELKEMMHRLVEVYRWMWT